MRTPSPHQSILKSRICKFIILTACALYTLGTYAFERELVWPKGKMPDAQPHQIAAMTDEAGGEKFKPDKHRVAYLEWFDAPATDVKNNGCMILISGGGYYNCCDVGLIALWRDTFTKLGFQCVNFVYRTPRPTGLPIYQTAWEDGQRAVRMVRSEAAKRGFDPERIGVIAMSAGSHLGLLLATSSQTPAYAPIDKLDEVPCHINWALLNAPAYVTTDAETGTPAPAWATASTSSCRTPSSSTRRPAPSACSMAATTNTRPTVPRSSTASYASAAYLPRCTSTPTDGTEPSALTAPWNSCARWATSGNLSPRCPS